MLNKLLQRLSSSRLAIVRRYDDMNGRHVGELYLLSHGVWRMIGASLDNLPFIAKEALLFRLDTRNSFLAPLSFRTIRVGGTCPEDDKVIRQTVRSLPRLGMRISIQNRFVEHVLSRDANGR